MKNVTWYMDSYGWLNVYEGSHSFSDIDSNNLEPFKVLKNDSDILAFMKTHYKEGNYSFPVLCDEYDVIEVEDNYISESQGLVYGNQYEVTILDETEIVFYYGTRFSQNFNFGNGANVYLFERLDGSQFECLPDCVKTWKEII